MKYILAILIIISSVCCAEPAQTICSVAYPANTTECHSDDTGECCVLQYIFADRKCAAVVCTEYDMCTWEVLIPMMCNSP